MKHIKKTIVIMIMTAMVFTMTIPHISDSAYAETKIPSKYNGTIAKQLVKYGKASKEESGYYSKCGVQTIDTCDLDGDKKSELIIVRITDEDTANLGVWTEKDGKVKRIVNESFDANPMLMYGTTVGVFKYKGKKYAGYRTGDMSNGTGAIHIYHYLYGPNSLDKHETFEGGIEYPDAKSAIDTVEICMESYGEGPTTDWGYNKEAADNVNEISQRSAIQKKITITGIEETTVKAKTSLTSSGKIKISWTKSKGYKVDSFEVYRSTSKDGKYKKIYTTESATASTYTDKSVKAGTKYYYKVRGVRKIGDKSYYTKWSNKANRTAGSKSSASWIDLYRSYLKNSEDLEGFVCLSDVKNNDGKPELLIGGMGMADSYITKMVYISDNKLKVKDYSGEDMFPTYKKKTGDVYTNPCNWRDDFSSYMTDSEINEFLNSWK